MAGLIQVKVPDDSVSPWRNGYPTCPVTPIRVRNSRWLQVREIGLRCQIQQVPESKAHRLIYSRLYVGASLMPLSVNAFHRESGWSRLPFYLPVNICSGVSMRNSGNFSSAPVKSVTLLVTIISELPANASSIRKLSPSSCKLGRHRKYTDTHWQTEYKPLTNSLISCASSGHGSRMFLLPITASYSENKVLLINGLYSFIKHRLRISLPGPFAPIRALTKTLVSTTIFSVMHQMIAYMMSIERRLKRQMQSLGHRPRSAFACW